ncbi:P2X purinoceptor 1 isoform X2 [Scleropages formosus]|uniref:P2X purinoceptor 1 isoform X2 n=1 Tax=Scleropages formosus TaxID=113540 RepID=UPI000878D675|nr:P2X purinoceptor 1 isoform X2 [Scleropages formosus]
MMNSLATALSDFFFEYETPRQVLVRNKHIGVVCRLVQLAVLGYIVGWVFLYEKGYQSTGSAVSSVLTKMKGVGFTRVNGTERVWDVADYVFPEQGDSSFVIMTNYIMTEGQRQGTCPEPSDQGLCKSDRDCDEGKFKRQMTGKCVNETGTCEVFAWCPIEHDREIPNPPLLMSSENYTLFIKNSITFPQFQVFRSNLVEGIDNKYLKSCIYNEEKDRYCPIFRLGDIVKLANFEFSAIAREGGTIGIIISWECNLDLPIKYCRPEYQFHGLYRSVEEEESAKASVGYNFRYAKYYMEGGVEKRTLIKVFGIRLDITVRGEARKFDIIPTLTAIGSGVGIFGVATVVCDLVLLHVLPKKNLYKNMKFKYTVSQEEEPVLHSDRMKKNGSSPSED